MKKRTLSRRSFFGKGLGVAGAMVASKSIAQECISASTPAQYLGPFFPDAGDPAHEIREVEGPHIALANDNDLTYIRGQEGRASGQEVLIQGTIQDSQCRPLAGATVIIWQASETGLYNHIGDQDNRTFLDPRNEEESIERKHDTNFQYWGSMTTGSDGQYLFKTVVPGFYPARLQVPNDPEHESNWYRPPHIHFRVIPVGEGQEEFITQMYFRGEALNDNDWIQTLNSRDSLLNNSTEGNPHTEEEKERLIVDFAANENGDLVGTFDIKL